MKRAEWFVTRGRGKWTKAMKPFLCDFKGHFGPCLQPVEKGELYLRTDIPKYPGSLDTAKRFVTFKYCFCCAEQELPAAHDIQMPTAALSAR